MLETLVLDSRTMVIKSDNEEDLPEIISIINQRDRLNNINAFLDFASKNRLIKGDYKFNREECYDR